MADIREYKCPACGGAMEFDSKTQKMKCPYCDTVADLSDFEETQSEKTASKEGAEQGETQEAAEEGAMMLYVCESCGGEILADKTTGATSCPYCGNKVVMKGQFDGALRPDYIIPFKKDKKQAKEAYRKHLEGKKFLPGVFKQQNHIDEIKGVYVPFWIFDLKAKADFSYHAEKTRVWVSNDIEYTEHENFEVKRAGTVEFEKVPADGSKKMDDTLMESVEPYDFKEAVPFRMAYMDSPAAVPEQAAEADLIISAADLETDSQAETVDSETTLAAETVVSAMDFPVQAVALAAGAVTFTPISQSASMKQHLAVTR